MAAQRNERRGRKHIRRTAVPYARTTRVNTGTGKRLLVTAAVVFAVISGIAIFFKVHTVDVRGNSVYDSQTVEAASGISKGDNLLAVNKAAVAGKIKASLPYVEQVRVERVPPNKVLLEIKESAAVFTVRSDSGQNWLMSFSGKLLEQVPTAEADQHPAIAGFAVKNPEAGKQAAAENADALAAALVVLQQLEGTGLAEKASKVDVSKPYDIVLWYTDQYEVRLGGTEQMDYKIDYLLAVLEQLTQYQTGTIDLTFDEQKVARFIPW